MIANSAWVQQGFPIHDAYRKLLATGGRATFELVDFVAKTEAARQRDQRLGRREDRAQDQGASSARRARQFERRIGVGQCDLLQRTMGQAL